MTTTISFATRNCIAIGCDSLGTISKNLVDYYDLRSHLFDEDGLPKLENGVPLQLTSSKLISMIESVPYNQIPALTKLHPFPKTKMACLFAGAGSIGDKTVRVLVEEFTERPEYNLLSQGSVEDLTREFGGYLHNEFTTNEDYGSMEVIVSGYSRDCRQPEIFKIDVSQDGSEVSEENRRGDYGIVFGGQHDIIQRVVNGIDLSLWTRLFRADDGLFDQYRNLVVKHLESKGITEHVPSLSEFGGVGALTDGNWPFNKLSSVLKQFSEQAAIDFIDFLIDLMIKAQQFSDRIPTVGGDTHIGIITYAKGFKWISKEQYKFRGDGVLKDI